MSRLVWMAVVALGAVTLLACESGGKEADVTQTTTMASPTPSAASTPAVTSVQTQTPPTETGASPTPTAVVPRPTLPPGTVLPPGGSSAATGLQASTSCSEAEPGKGIADLSWTPAASPGSEQRIQVTIFDFESGN